MWRRKSFCVFKKESMERKVKEIGLYIHIPFCNKVCPYCDFHKMVASDNLKEKYIKALIKELMKIKK